MIRAILFGVGIVGGVYMFELQTGADYGVGRTFQAVASSFAGGYGMSLGGATGGGGAVSGVASGAAGLAGAAAGALGN